MATDNENDFRREEDSAPAGVLPVQPPRPPVDPFADMRHVAPRPSRYEALESAGPPV